MKRVLVAEVGKIQVIESDLPQPPADHALIKTIATGICGSDTHALAGHHPLLPPPYFPGHEAIGVVEQAASDGTGPQAGTRIMLKPNVACGTCINCTSERSNACQVLAWVGCDPSGALPGGMAEFFSAPASNLYELPDDVTDEQAVLIECLSTPVHAARIAGDITGARVVIMGAGTIGILMLLAAREAGAGTIVMTDLDSSKLQRGLRLGADGAVDAAAEDFSDQVLSALGGQADVIFDCVAMEPSAAQWPALVRRAATICIVGVPPRPFTIPMPLVQDWELRVQGCAGYTESDVETAISMATRIPADEIITAVYGLDDAVRAFEEATQFSSGKVLVGPGMTPR